MFPIKSYACTILVLFLSYYIIIYYPFSPSLVPTPQHNSSQSPSPISTTNSSIEITRLTSARIVYLADLTVGSQQMKQSLIVDIGSNLLWIYYEPCVNHAPEPFRPTSSTSFEREDCINSSICHGTGAVKLGSCKKGSCPYFVRYGLGNSSGYLARDTFVLGTTSKVVDKKTVFGCAKRSAKLTASNNGVLGLGSNQGRIQDSKVG